MLLPVLSGQKSCEEIITHGADWYATHGVTFRFGEKVMAIDRARKVVIGSGLLGLEAAAGMQLRGMDVTVIHLMGHLMERQLDPAAGYLLQKALEKRGIHIQCEGATKAISGGAKLDPMAAVAALPPEGEICGCNGVSKGKIVKAVLAGANILDLVRARTRAASSCGTWTGLVEQVMAVTLGDGFVAIANPPMCKCTDHTHEDVRRLIKAIGLKPIPAVMQELAWKTVGGCQSCRPALNCYLLSERPLEYKDDRQSRFVYERNHANIQKDGTYSVVPRMWGRVTTPAELRAIADAADKFNVPMVNADGGHAYSKGLRTVKTCVGTEFCRFGTQDSTGLGIRLEKLLWGSWSPAKVKLGVSGCPRNCAEATCRDVGIACVDSGYEIGVAGAAGMDVKQTEFLCRVATEEEVTQVTAAFIHLYRENARYLHRIYKWVANVRLDWCRELVADPANRRALYDRFMLSQTIYQVDPRVEHARAEERPKWRPLADLTLEVAE